jgi:hypothetical protein
MMKRAADVEQTRAATEIAQDANLRNSIVSINGLYGVWLADRTFMPFDLYDNLLRQGKAPKTLGYKPDPNSKEYQEAAAKTAAKSGQPTGLAPPTSSAAAIAEAQPKPSGLLDDASMRRAAEDRAALHKGSASADDAAKFSNAYRTVVQNDSSNATKNNQHVLKLAGTVSKAAQEKGLGVMGVGYGARAGILGAGNTLSEGLNLGSISEVPKYAIEFNKIATQLADVGSDEKTLGQFQANKSAIANGTMDADTAASLTADLWVANRMAQDQALHANQWGKVSGGNYQSAQTDFNDKFNAQRLTAEKKVLTDLIRNHGDILDKLTSPSITPKEIDQLFQERYNLKNMSRYFTKGQ